MMGTEKMQPFYNKNVPDDWTILEFGDVFSFLKSYSFSRDQLTSEKTVDEIRNIHYGDIHANYHSEILDFEVEQSVPYLLDGFISLDNFDNENFPALKEGDLVIADASEDYLGVCDCVELKNVGNRKIVGGLHTFIARADENKIVKGFRAYTLNNEQVIRELRRVATGTSVYGVSKTNLSKIKVPLPPTSDQKIIATNLALMDELINNNKKLISYKEKNKKWLMQQLLSGKKRLKGFNEVWEETKLADIFHRITRKNNVGSTNVVTISAQRGFVNQRDFFNKNIASEILDNYFLVNRGEFCYNKSYSNGYPWGATKRLNDFENAVVTTLYICFGISNEYITSGLFFEQYFNANLLDKGLTKIAHEGGRAHGLLNVTPSDFFSLGIKIPKVQEQTAIATILETADKEIRLFKEKVEKLKEQKKGMMQVLLTGKKRLKID